MGKRKKAPGNIVKIDLEEYAVKGGEILPILVQHSSKDGRRIEQTVHEVPNPRNNLPPPTFNPSPAFEAAWDNMFPELCESDGTERVRPRFLPLRHILTWLCLIAGPAACLARGM